MPRKLAETPTNSAQEYHRLHRAEILAHKKAKYEALSEEERAEGNAGKRARYAAKREEIKAQRKEQRLANLEEERAKATAWRTANPEKVNGQQKRADARRKDRPERIAQKRARYTNRDVEEYLEKQRQWRIANPDIVRAAHKRRKARVRGATISDFTAQQWRIVQEAFDHCCAYCKKRCKGHLTQDHVIPLILGGNHTLSNIVPACGPCNFSKHTGPVPVPVQPLLLAVPASTNPNAPPKKKKAA